MIRSKGFTIDNFYIPPFSVNKGEIAVIELPNGAFFMETLFEMVDVLTKKKSNSDVIIEAEFMFVNHITETGWTRIFRPMTVGRFIKTHGNPSDNIANRVYSLCDLKPAIQIKRMPGNHRKLLSLLTTLSWTNNIIFDLIGVDPTGGQQAYDIAMETARKGGSVILLDNYHEFKNDCTTYIKYEVMK